MKPVYFEFKLWAQTRKQRLLWGAWTQLFRAASARVTHGNRTFVTPFLFYSLYFNFHRVVRFSWVRERKLKTRQYQSVPIAVFILCSYKLVLNFEYIYFQSPTTLKKIEHESIRVNKSYQYKFDPTLIFNIWGGGGTIYAKLNVEILTWSKPPTVLIKLIKSLTPATSLQRHSSYTSQSVHNLTSRWQKRPTNKHGVIEITACAKGNRCCLYI